MHTLPSVNTFTRIFGLKHFGSLLDFWLPDARA